MASVKLASLFIRTLAKPISSKLKIQAQEHETFRRACVALAQRLHSLEVRMRGNLLGDPHAQKHSRPLSEARAIQQGANAIAETFLFVVAAGLILGETWRSSRKETSRREDVAERLENLEGAVQELKRSAKLDHDRWERLEETSRSRTEALERILDRVVGIRGEWPEELRRLGRHGKAVTALRDALEDAVALEVGEDGESHAVSPLGWRAREKEEDETRPREEEGVVA